MMFDDSQLLVLAGQGDRIAMGELYRRHKHRVTAFFRRMRVNESNVEDFVHEVFLRIWRRAHTYSPRGRYMSFMFTVAANVWRDQRRKTIVRVGTDDRDVHTSVVGTEQRTPGTASEAAEFRRDLDDALEKLSENDRLVFVLSEIEGLSYREIAIFLKCRIGTVGSRKARAVARLRKILAAHDPKEDRNNEMPERNATASVR